MSQSYAVQRAAFDGVRDPLCMCLQPLKTPCSEKSVFDSVEELTQLWAYAEDLETFEYARKEYLSIFAGPVRAFAYLRVRPLMNPRHSTHTLTFSTRCANSRDR